MLSNIKLENFHRYFFSRLHLHIHFNFILILHIHIFLPTYLSLCWLVTEAFRIWCGFLAVTVFGTSGTCGDEQNPREGPQEGRPDSAIVPLPQSLLQRQGVGRQQPWDWRSAGFVLQQSTPAMASSSSGMTLRSVFASFNFFKPKIVGTQRAPAFFRRWSHPSDEFYG